MPRRLLAALFFLALLTPALAQQQPTMPDMPGQLNHLTSGTSAEPASTPMYMIMSHRAGWMLMLHGSGFIADTQQHSSTGRGGDKFFSTNWIMPMAMRQVGPGQLTLRAMFSLEPATVTSRQYPELFQQGETAFNKPIIDGQHPHDFFMELGALYDIRLGERALLSFYAAPIGDPAIGPTAYPHRMSASEDPIAALGHHQEDSTHIAFNVLTAGFTWRGLRFEQSGFHGGEPSEQRWQFQPSSNGHAIDSYSSRVTFSPSANWSGQYSIAHIVSPEALYPGEDQQRQTASIMYNRPFGKKDSNGLTSGNAGRSTELLLPPGTALPPNFEESPIGHVQAYTLGYDRDFRIAPHILAAPGAQFTLYNTPQALVSTYGKNPFGAVAFVRLRISQ